MLIGHLHGDATPGAQRIIAGAPCHSLLRPRNGAQDQGRGRATSGNVAPLHGRVRGIRKVGAAEPGRGGGDRHALDSRRRSRGYESGDPAFALRPSHSKYTVAMYNDVTLAFAPEEFHMTRLQQAGRLLGVEGRTVRLGEVSRAAATAIARDTGCAQSTATMADDCTGHAARRRRARPAAGALATLGAARRTGAVVLPIAR